MDRWNSIETLQVSSRVSFRFLGHRNYVHGTSMLDALLDAMAPLVAGSWSADARILQFRVIREVACGGNAFAMNTAAAHTHPQMGKAVARLDLLNGGQKLTAFLVGDLGAPVAARIQEYNAGSYVSRLLSAEDGGRIIKTQGIATRIDLIRAIIEGMRQAEAEERGKTIDIQRWGYLTDFPLMTDAEAAKISTVALGPAKLLSGGGRTRLSPPGRTRFSLRSIRIAEFGEERHPEMCFFLHLAEGGMPVELRGQHG